MTADLPVTELLDHAARIGFHLSIAPPGTPDCALYIWATVLGDGSPGDVLYIGKAESGGRIPYEQGFADVDPHGDRVYSGFISLIRRNRAQCFPLIINPVNGRTDGFDPTPALNAIANWNDDAPGKIALTQRINEGQWTVPDIEMILIRIAVRTGVPIGNSIGATQWEGPVSKARDTLAVLATDPVRAADPDHREAAR